MNSRLLSIFLINIFSLSSVLTDNETVELSYGKLIGNSKSNYISFESIPYAEPPIGENRFEPPKLYSGIWNEPRDATKQTHQQCIQFNHQTSSAVGSEDCLYLNIFTPTLEIGKTFPVFVYIHGGGYRSGSDHMFGEDIIMESGKFVYVSFNYRLGPLGFMSTNCKAIPGNMGLKDQRLALKWIKDNIAKFNGDPEQIILSGFSSGGASVHLHLMSKETEKLIKVAISYAGSALNPWGFDYLLPKNKSIAVGTEFKCPTTSMMAMKNCLKKVQAEDLVIKGATLFTKFLDYPISIFAPVVELNTTPESFITDLPENIIRKGQTANIPWLISRCADEGGILAPVLLNYNANDTQNIVEFSERFEEVLPVIFYYENLNKVDKDLMTSYLRRIYDLKENIDITEQNYWNVQRMMSNELMINPIENAVKLQRQYGKATIYYYIYDNPPPYGFGNLMSNRSDINFGTIHSDDMLLVLKSNIRDRYPWTDTEKKLSEKLLDMYVHFVQTTVATFDNTMFPTEMGDNLSTPKALLITKNSV